MAWQGRSAAGLLHCVTHHTGGFLQTICNPNPALQQLLWRLGDAKASPAAAARTFVGQYLQQPHLVERESQ